jgi:hypothetical protein
VRDALLEANDLVGLGVEEPVLDLDPEQPRDDVVKLRLVPVIV